MKRYSLLIGFSLKKNNWNQCKPVNSLMLQSVQFRCSQVSRLTFIEKSDSVNVDPKFVTRVQSAVCPGIIPCSNVCDFRALMDVQLGFHRRWMINDVTRQHNLMAVNECRWIPVLLMTLLWNSHVALPLSAGSHGAPVECEVDSWSLLWTEALGHTHNIDAHVFRWWASLSTHASDALEPTSATTLIISKAFPQWKSCMCIYF